MHPLPIRCSIAEAVGSVCVVVVVAEGGALVFFGAGLDVFFTGFAAGEVPLGGAGDLPRAFGGISYGRLCE